MPVIEFVQFSTTESYRADPTLGKRALEIISKADGYIQSYGGIQLEDKVTAHLAVVWKTLEHHIAIRSHESYPELMEQFKVLADGPLDIKHVKFESDVDVSKIFELGVTELAYITLKEGVKNEDFELEGPLLEKAINDTGIHPPVIWGQTVEAKDKYILAVGWPAVQDHITAVSSPGAQAVLGKLRSISELKPVHVAMHPGPILSGSRNLAQNVKGE